MLTRYYFGYAAQARAPVAEKLAAAAQAANASRLTARAAYGRTYKNAAAIKADWDAGKDFVVADFYSPWDGKPINKQDARDAGISVSVRYAEDRKVCVVK